MGKQWPQMMPLAVQSYVGQIHVLYRHTQLLLTQRKESEGAAHALDLRNKAQPLCRASDGFESGCVTIYPACTSLLSS